MKWSYSDEKGNQINVERDVLQFDPKMQITHLKFNCNQIYSEIDSTSRDGFFFFFL